MPAPQDPAPNPAIAPSIVPLRTALPNSRVTPRFAGLCTFARVPRLEDVAPEHLPVDWAIYGVAHDAGVTFRPGARFGPRAIRDASQYLKPYHLEFGVNLAERFSIADAGDAPLRPYGLKDSLDGAAAFATALLASPACSAHTRLLALGGDHSIALANLRATWQRLGSPAGGLALLHFDSHLDTVDQVWGESWGHASVFIRAIEAGLVNPARMLSIGVKGPLNTGADLDYAARQGVTLVRAAEWLARGIEIARDYLRRVQGAPVYVTFDVDVVDPAFAPGTGTPSIGGLTSAQALDAIRSFRGLRIAGADVVEVLPDRDVAQITALLAAHVAFEIMALDAVCS